MLGPLAAHYWHAGTLISCFGCRRSVVLTMNSYFLVVLTICTVRTAQSL